MADSKNTQPEAKIEDSTVPVGTGPRQSKVRFGISRTLNTAKYESIVINYEIEENLTWNDPAERRKKLANWEGVFIREYKETHDRILKECDLSHKSAYFVRAEEKVDQRVEPGQKHELDSLDTLDILGA